MFLRLLRQVVWRAFSRAWAKTGKRIAARIAIMAITTSSSMRVNPLLERALPLFIERTSLKRKKEKDTARVRVVSAIAHVEQVSRSRKRKQKHKRTRAV